MMPNLKQSQIESNTIECNIIKKKKNNNNKKSFQVKKKKTM